jgi:hypothetical protein
LNSFSISEKVEPALRNVYSVIRVMGPNQITSVSIELVDDKTRAYLKIGNAIARNYELTVRRKNSKMIIHPFEAVRLGSVKAIYRNLRENYEYRMRYDEAGKFFIREMELRRKYREVYTKSGIEVKASGSFRRNVCLTKIYSILAKYGESLLRPFIFGAAVLTLSTAYWISQSNSPITLVLLKGLGNSFERSITVFLQLKNDQLLWQDYVVKFLGVIGLGVFLIGLRRKFERKFRH